MNLVPADPEHAEALIGGTYVEYSHEGAEARGYVFYTPQEGDGEVLVHLSATPIGERFRGSRAGDEVMLDVRYLHYDPASCEIPRKEVR